MSSVQNILCSNGYGVVWLFGEIGNQDNFFASLKQTLIDNFIQGWHSKMSSDMNCLFYYGLKPIIETELYLRNHNLKLYLRNVLVKFRLGVTAINCHRYMYSSYLELKKCPFCVRDTFEDELHVLFICPLYEDIRHKYFNDSLIIDQNKVHEFIVDHYYIVSKYLHDAFIVRNRILDKRIKK